MLKTTGKFIYLGNILDFELNIFTLSTNLKIKLNNKKTKPIEKYILDEDNFSMSMMLEKWYLDNGVSKLVSNLLNYDIYNACYVTEYEGLMIVVNNKFDKIDKINSLSYRTDDGNVLVSIGIISKVYNDINQIYNYSTYLAQDVLKIPINQINHIISTINLVDKMIDTSKMNFEFVSTTNIDKFKNIDYNVTTDNLKILNICDITDDVIVPNYLKESLERLYTDTNLNEKIKEDIINNTSKIKKYDMLNMII